MNVSDRTKKRFEAKFFKASKEQCWPWNGAIDGSGYASFYNAGTITGHRMSYLIYVGPIPAGKQLDHLCRNRACVNPYHLEPVTQAENIRRGQAGVNSTERTHCPKGHSYSQENTYIDPRGFRNCRTCRAASVKKHRSEEREHV